MTRLVRPLMYLGIAAVVVGMSEVHAKWIADPPYDYTGSFRFAWSLAYIALLAIAAYGVGLPDVPRTTRSAVVAALSAAALAAVAISLVQLAVGDALLPRFVVFGSALILVPFYLACIALAVGGRSLATAQDRVLVVGDSLDTNALRRDLELEAEKPAQLVSVLTRAESLPRPDGGEPLVDIAVEQRATVLVLDHDAQADAVVVDVAARLHEQGVRVRTLSLFYDEWLGKLPVGELERVSLMFDIGELHRARYGRTKRAVDVALGLVGLLALILVIPLVVVGDLIANRGALFYRQARVGKGGSEFELLKFRTMRAPDASGESSEWTTEGDPRVTPFGRVLRATHLDELPQVMNILKGDLSAVGPRPEQPRYVRELEEKLPFYHLRHLVQPGLTGWAQVKYGYASDTDDALEKLQYDFFYLRHQSLSFDMKIVGRTLRSVVRGEGR